MNQEKIGKFIAQCRKDKKMTQQELAEKLNVTDKTISRWENGHYLPDVSLFNELCNILDIEVVELLNGEKSKNNIDREIYAEILDKIRTTSSDGVDVIRKLSEKFFNEYNIPTYKNTDGFFPKILKDKLGFGGKGQFVANNEEQ